MHYYSFNIADYRKDTVHLTPMEHYIYRSLLDWYYLDEIYIPTDTEWVLRRLGLGSEWLSSLQNVLKDFFKLGENGWQNYRADLVIEDYRRQCEANRTNGKLGGRPKKTQWVHFANRNESEINPNHKPITNNQYNNSMSGKPDVATPQDKIENRKINDDARHVLSFLNAKTGRNYRPVEANLCMIRARLKEASVQDCKSIIAKKCRDWMNDEKMATYLRPATLFNRTKFAQYQGELLNLSENLEAK